MVSLIFRGAAIESVYTDSQGTFGFHSLGPNPYSVSIEDDRYDRLEEAAVIEANSLAPVVFLNLTLVPKAINAHPAAEKQSRFEGANPDMADAREYSAHFPKNTLKEFQKGVAADRDGKKEDAIRHYAKALQTSPRFYPAHNNLGSDYLSKSDFPDARKEFEEVIRLNQSDAAGYFNLSNVCMMTGQLADAQRYLEEGMRRQPDSALGHYLLGSLDIKAGKYELAEGVLLQTIQLSPTMVQARLQLVNLLLQEGRKSEASDQLRDFVKTFPDSSFAPRARLLLQKLNSPAQPPVSR